MGRGERKLMEQFQAENVPWQGHSYHLWRFLDRIDWLLIQWRQPGVLSTLTASQMKLSGAATRKVHTHFIFNFPARHQ